MLMPSSAFTVRELNTESAVSKVTLALSPVASNVSIPAKPSLSAASTLFTVIEAELLSPIVVVPPTVMFDSSALERS